MSRNGRKPKKGLASDGHAEWRWHWYEVDAKKTPEDALDGFEKVTGTRYFAIAGSTKNHSDLKKNVFTLNFKV